MSVNRNVNTIQGLQPEVNRAPVRYNFDATVYVVGGGGGGQQAIGTDNGLGGGGGAGALVVSQSLSVVPNITWTIDVGAGGASDTDGQETSVIAYNDNYSGLYTYRSQGGRTGGVGQGQGGNSGTGSVETSAATSSYAEFLGGANVSGGGRNAGGGGAGSSDSGSIGSVYDGNPGSGIGGIGGIGVTIPTVTGNLDLAGGGGGGVTSDLQSPGPGVFGGGDGGQNAIRFGD